MPALPYSFFFYSTDEDGKPSVSHDDGGEGVSLEEEKSRMVLLLGSLNRVCECTCVCVCGGAVCLNTNVGFNALYTCNVWCVGCKGCHV